MQGGIAPTCGKRRADEVGISGTCMRDQEANPPCVEPGLFVAEVCNLKEQEPAREVGQAGGEGAKKDRSEACSETSLSQEEVLALRRKLQNKLCEEALEDLEEAILRPEDFERGAHEVSLDANHEAPAGQRAEGPSQQQSRSRWLRPMTFVAKQRVLNSASIVQALLCFGVLNAVVFQDVFMPPDEFRKFALSIGSDRCSGLQALCMDWTRVDAPAELATALGTNTTLKSLEINNAALSQADAESLAVGIAENGKRGGGISSIDLSNNDVGAGGASAIFACIASNQGVTSLRLAFNALGAEGGRAIARFLPGASLTSLNISGNALRDSGVSALATVLGGSGCTHLVDLALSQNGLTDSSAKQLAAAMVRKRDAGEPPLEALNLGYNRIGAKGAKALGLASEAGAGPSRLVLRGNPVGDAGARAVSGAAAKGQLVEADLNGCGVRAGGAGALARALEEPMCMLASLDLGGNSVKAAGAAQLATALAEGGRWGLSTLNLARNGLGCEGVMSLVRGLELNRSLASLYAQGNAVPRGKVEELRAAAEGAGEARSRLSRSHALAFVMGSHSRLGSGSCAGRLDAALMQWIASLADTCVSRTVSL